MSSWTTDIPPLDAVLLERVVMLAVKVLVPNFLERHANLHERLQARGDLAFGFLQESLFAGG